MSSIYLCPWCGTTLKDAEAGDYGAVCNLCLEQISETNRLSFEELYSLPYGAITLDEDGVVTSYNQWEQNLSGKSVAEVIGKNFFTQIAPCTQVNEFAGRFADFISSERRVEAFEFTFPFPHRAIQVNIAFVKSEAETDPHRATVLVKRT